MGHAAGTTRDISMGALCDVPHRAWCTATQLRAENGCLLMRTVHTWSFCAWPSGPTRRSGSWRRGSHTERRLRVSFQPFLAFDVSRLPSDVTSRILASVAGTAMASDRDCCPGLRLSRRQSNGRHKMQTHSSSGCGTNGYHTSCRGCGTSSGVYRCFISHCLVSCFLFAVVHTPLLACRPFTASIPLTRVAALHLPFPLSVSGRSIAPASQMQRLYLQRRSTLY